VRDRIQLFRRQIDTDSLCIDRENVYDGPPTVVCWS